MEEIYMTADDVAKKLNVSKAAVYGWIHRGIAPPYVRLNGAVRFPSSAFKQWLKNKLVFPESVAA